MINDDFSEARGDYLASVSEDYYFANNPDPQHPMTETERTAAIERYEKEIYALASSIPVDDAVGQGDV